MNKSFFKALLFSLTVLLFASCDKDFNEIGIDIIGEEHFGIYSSDVSVVAYNNKFGVVQTNNLPVNSLGIYTNPFFGKTKASVVTQVELKNPNPTDRPNPVVTKVELSVPYFSEVDSTDSDGNRTYELDSIFGNGRIKLSIHESNYFLRDLDPATGFQEPQAYYSDFDMSNNYNTAVLNDSSALEQNENFYFDNREVVTYKLDDNGNNVVDTRSKPAMTVSLDTLFFKQKLFGPEAQGNLINNNAFKQYFRGLYFKVDHSANFPSEEALSLINFSQGTVTVSYTAETMRKNSDGELILVDGLPERGPYSIILTLTGNTVNILETTESAAYTAGTSNPNQTEGDEKLYLKGGTGSSAIIELFGSQDNYQYNDSDNDENTPGILVETPNGVPDQLDDIRNDGWMVNDATLTFYIDQSDPNFQNSPEPNRIYLYDYENRRPVVDFYTDLTVAGNPKFSKFVHDGIINPIGAADGGERGTKYRVRLTNHIRSIVNSTVDSTNVKLGLVVTESIALISSGKKKNHQTPPVTNDWVPTASIINPLGTIIYGTNPSNPADFDKRLKLEIYYTKPN